MPRSCALKILSWIVLALAMPVLLILIEGTPWLRLLCMLGIVLPIVRTAAFLRQLADGLRPRSLIGFFAYVFLWPGISYEGFDRRLPEPPLHTGGNFLEAWLFLMGGIAAFAASSVFGRGESTLWNYVALFSVLSIVHMGFIEVLADGFRLTGLNPGSLFRRPLLAASLRDFWSNRWNLAFVDMNRLFIMKPLKNKVPRGALVLMIFLLSGMVHELAISFPARMWPGLPTLYFLFQGFGFLIEKNWPRPLVLAWIILPAPVLFPPGFVNLFLGESTHGFYLYLSRFTLSEFIHYGFILGAAMHALVLVASIQVPSRLNWKEEFQRLNALSRKAFWTYGAYIFTIIVFMGAVSAHLAGLADFTRSDLIWAAFIALFWWGRVIADTFYMKHEDWPRGPLFDVGHICLFTLFLSMTALYTGLAIAVAGKV
jgi:alginate O-acetyltransferase complex protein AlgI